MARQRRGGFKPPELKGTLGTLLRTTLQQAGAVREALERGAREGRSKIDEVMSGRRRNEALAELGEIVLQLIRDGEIDLVELPEVKNIVDHLDELDAAEPPEEAPPPPTTRKRFDSRGKPEDGTVSAATWAPPKRAKSQTTVWRPGADKHARPADEVTARERPAASPRKGGISFEDEDLADYMHPDDVPPKKEPEGGS